MEWSNLLIKKREISSLQLEKTDVTYQVWELGRVIAKIFEICHLIKSLDKSIKNEDSAKLTKKARKMAHSLKSLSKKLSADPPRVLINEEEIIKKTKSLFEKIEENIKGVSVNSFDQEIEELEDIIASELRSNSVHLHNIFTFSKRLRYLKTKLVYEINSSDIGVLIDNAVLNLDKLALGDKILASPNLEITHQNLKIIKHRLKGIKEHLPNLRKIARENEDAEDKKEFKRNIENKCNMWTSLLLDLKNPSDFLPLRQKIKNKILILAAYYYLIAIPLVAILYFGLHSMIWDLKCPLPPPQRLALLSGLIPILISFYLWLIKFIKDKLIVSSFKFKIYQFQTKSNKKKDEKKLLLNVE